MNKHFFYCFFKYVHSLRLGESLNIGLLIAFPSDSTIIFKYPPDLQRLKCTYFDFEEEQLRFYLKSFDEKAKTLCYNLNTFFSSTLDHEEFLQLIKKEFLPEDEGALQFSHIRKAVKYTDNINEITEDLYYSYFLHYYEPEDATSKKRIIEPVRRDEKYILSTLHDMIINANPVLRSLSFTGEEIITPNASLIFDFAWTNHGLHLVKPLSLDYRDKKTIEEKAHSLHSKLHILDKGVDHLRDCKFDVMVSKPNLSKLEPAYMKAISILQESSAKTRVIEEDQYLSYSKEAANALSV